ncbi:hypothetical protein [Kitasatospora terrestris]|uniref:Transposase n=1 Tax=Kitasatospora terrestris TaxID=258051 RepID=A0ABP9E235_9ACTN
MPLDLRPRTAAFCRWHGELCRMGTLWPVDPPEPNPQDQALWQLVRQARGEPEPDREKARTAWYLDRHEPVSPKREKARSAELQQLLVEVEARNAERLAEVARRYEGAHRAR